MIRKTMLSGLLLLSWLPISVFGCAQKDESVDAPKGPPPGGAPIDNNAPGAKAAPAAPGPGPDVPSPGGGGMKGKMGKPAGG